MPLSKTPRPGIAATAALLGLATCTTVDHAHMGIADAGYDAPSAAVIEPQQGVAEAAEARVERERVRVSLVLAVPEDWDRTAVAYDPVRPGRPVIDTRYQQTVNPDAISLFRNQLVATFVLPRDRQVRVYVDLGRTGSAEPAPYRFEIDTGAPVQTFGSNEPLRSATEIQTLRFDNCDPVRLGASTVALNSAQWIDGVLQAAAVREYRNDTPVSQRLTVEAQPGCAVFVNGERVDDTLPLEVPPGASFVVMAHSPDFACASDPAQIVIGLAPQAE